MINFKTIKVNLNKRSYPILIGENLESILQKSLKKIDTYSKTIFSVLFDSTKFNNGISIEILNVSKIIVIIEIKKSILKYLFSTGVNI